MEGWMGEQTNEKTNGNKQTNDQTNGMNGDV